MKMRGILVGVVLFAISAACADCDAWDRAEARARELCARMTLEEKAGELMVYDYRCLGDDAWGAYTNLADAAKRGLEAGVDMDMISRAFLELPKLVRDGQVEERLLDEGVFALNSDKTEADIPVEYSEDRAIPHEGSSQAAACRQRQLRNG